MDGILRNFGVLESLEKEKSTHQVLFQVPVSVFIGFGDPPRPTLRSHLNLEFVG